MQKYERSTFNSTLKYDYLPLITQTYLKLAVNALILCKNFVKISAKLCKISAEFTAGLCKTYANFNKDI